VSLCGDTFIDGGASPPEECDDGNNTEGDGCDNDCTYSCHADDDCLDGEMCNGDETCDTGGTHTCLPGENLSEGTGCDDGLFCTAVDECDGIGHCVGTGNPCFDGLSCTSDICDEAADPHCSYPVDDGFCLIGGVCYGDGDANPDEQCQECRSSASSTSWSALDDMTLCDPGEDLGVCCGGVCRVGGNCCDDSDCFPYCAGDAIPCDSIFDADICRSQTGCLWVLSSEPDCVGLRTCWDITGLGEDDCIACGCDGARMGPDGVLHCTNNSGLLPPPCGGYETPEMCLMCGCDLVWDGFCSGTHAECSTYTTRVSCNPQMNCDWIGGTCHDYNCL